MFLVVRDHGQLPGLQGLASILRNHAVLSPSASCHDTSAACHRLVLADGVVVGRIMKAAAKPADASWLWTLAYGYHEDRTPTHGYEPPREAAMAAFRELAEGMRDTS